MEIKKIRFFDQLYLISQHKKRRFVIMMHFVKDLLVSQSLQDNHKQFCIHDNHMDVILG